MVDGLERFIERFDIETRIVSGKKYLVLYKAVCKDFGSWFNRTAGNISINDKGAYLPGTLVKCRKWSKNRKNECSFGLNVGDYYFAKNFCYTARLSNLKLIEVLVAPKDVVCVPYNNDGKIRCKKLFVTKSIKISSQIFHFLKSI